MDERIDIDDQRVLSVLDKMLKQRRDSIEQYRAAGRDDLAIIEEQEMVVIQSFPPTPLSESDIAELITAAIADTGLNSIARHGKNNGAIKTAIARPRKAIGAVSDKIKAAQIKKGLFTDDGWPHSQHFIDNILDRVDIVEVIDRRVSLKKGCRNYLAWLPISQ